MVSKVLFVVLFSFLFVIGCERYSAFKDAELVAEFSKKKIEVGENFVLSFKVVSSTRGSFSLPKDRLCSLRFFLRQSSGKVNERFCASADSEEIEVSQSKSFSFDVQGHLQKYGNGVKLEFADDVYFVVEESNELNIMLEYVPKVFESDSSIHLARPILIELKEEKVFIE